MTFCIFFWIFGLLGFFFIFLYSFEIYLNFDDFFWIYSVFLEFLSKLLWLLHTKSYKVTTGHQKSPKKNGQKSIVLFYLFFSPEWLKWIQKYHVFLSFWEISEGQNLTQHIKYITRPNFDNTLSTFCLKTVMFHSFFV